MQRRGRAQAGQSLAELPIALVLLLGSRSPSTVSGPGAPVASLVRQRRPFCDARTPP